MTRALLRQPAIAAGFLLSLAACRERAAMSRLPPLQDTAAFRAAGEHGARGRFAVAAQEYARLRDSFALVGDSVNQWYGQLWWAEMMTRASEPDSAAQGLQRAEALAGSDPRRHAWVAVMRSKYYERTGQLDSAIALAERAVAASEALQDPDIGFWAYDMLGTALSFRGRYREALAADSASLAIRRAINAGTGRIAAGLNEVAIGYRHLGRYDDARVALEESYRLARAMHDTLLMAVARGNLSNVWDAVGDRDRAITTLGEAYAHVHAIGHRRFMVSSGNQLAAHLLEAGQVEAARGLAEQSVSLARSTRNRFGEVEGLETVAGTDLARGRPAAAKPTLRGAIELADQAGLGSNRVDLRILLAESELALRNLSAALKAADAALSIADSLGDPALRFSAQVLRARVLEAARSPAALSGYDSAMALLESLRGRLAMGDLAMGIGGPRLSAYEGAIRVLLAANRPMEAFAVAERSRARLLLELMADRGLGGEATRHDQVRRRLRDAYESRKGVDEPHLVAALDRQITALGDTLAALERELVAADPAAAVRYPGVLPTATIRQTLLGPDRALLAYFWGDSSVVGWWITADTVRSATLGRVGDLASTIDFLTAAIERREDSVAWRSAAARAYRQLVSPLGPAPAAARIVVIADGPLHRVPLEVFLPDSSGIPWGADRHFSYGPSASVLATLARAPRPRWSRNLLTVGNPAPRRRDSAVVLAGIDFRAASLGSLPHAEGEARAIHRLFDAARGDLLVGRKATMDRWLDRDPGRYRYLHFALHAVASDRQPDAGALLFADQELELAQVRQLRLQSELASLSACETGVGRWVRGEGVVGMQHAFLAAGVRNVVVTLWQVADQSTADFMQQFYSEIKAGQPVAAALARVKAEWIRADGERAHPWRWAPFILVGSPVAGSTN